MNNNRTDMEKLAQPPAPEGFIGKPEVARRLGRTVRTVDAWMKKGVVPYYKPDRRVLFRWADIEQHIIANFRVTGPNHPSANAGKHPKVSLRKSQPRLTEGRPVSRAEALVKVGVADKAFVTGEKTA